MRYADGQEAAGDWQDGALVTRTAAPLDGAAPDAATEEASD